MEMETQFAGDLGPLNLYPMTVITPNLREWLFMPETVEVVYSHQLVLSDPGEIKWLYCLKNRLIKLKFKETDVQNVKPWYTLAK